MSRQGPWLKFRVIGQRRVPRKCRLTSDAPEAGLGDRGRQEPDIIRIRSSRESANLRILQSRGWGQKIYYFTFWLTKEGKVAYLQFNPE